MNKFEKEAEKFDKDQEIKQVIVMRADLGMRKGKAAAQAGHASMLWMVHRLSVKAHEYPNVTGDFDKHEVEWFTASGMTKICVRVESEEELMEVHRHALSEGLLSHVVTDSGHTEFHGVPTRTCLAIGPDFGHRVNPVTGHLKLY
jgi:PTH2 family peptidyl-tRNA hydrolase